MPQPRPEQTRSRLKPVPHRAEPAESRRPRTSPRGRHRCHPAPTTGEATSPGDPRGIPPAKSESPTNAPPRSPNRSHRGRERFVVPGTRSPGERSTPTSPRRPVRPLAHRRRLHQRGAEDQWSCQDPLSAKAVRQVASPTLQPLLHHFDPEIHRVGDLLHRTSTTRLAFDAIAVVLRKSPNAVLELTSPGPVVLDLHSLKATDPDFEGLEEIVTHRTFPTCLATGSEGSAGGDAAKPGAEGSRRIEIVESPPCHQGCLLKDVVDQRGCPEDRSDEGRQGPGILPKQHFEDPFGIRRGWRTGMGHVSRLRHPTSSGHPIPHFCPPRWRFRPHIEIPFPKTRETTDLITPINHLRMVTWTNSTKIRDRGTST